MCAKTDHRLDGETHAGRGGTHSLVLCIVWDIGSGVEELIDAVSTICLDHAASSALGMLLYDGTWVAKEHARLDKLDGFIQTFSSGLRDPDRVWVRPCSIAHIIRLIEIPVKPTMIKGHVEIENVSIE